MSEMICNGITIGYDDEGTGDPLLLVHGHPFDRSMWRPQVEQFSRTGWRMIAPDLRGYGDTTVVPGTTRWETFAHDLAGLLDQLEIETAVLCGLSMGGQIVMEFHRLFPQRVRGLVLADTSAPAETTDGRRARHELADRLSREGLGRYAEEVLPRMVAPSTIRTLPLVAGHVLGMMRAAPAEGAAAALRGRAGRPDYVDMLPSVAVPTLVVVGRDDDFTPLADAELMHRRIPHSTLVVVDGAGHLPNLERPAKFNAELARFLDSLPAPAQDPAACSSTRDLIATDSGVAPARVGGGHGG